MFRVRSRSARSSLPREPCTPRGWMEVRQVAAGRPRPAGASMHEIARGPPARARPQRAKREGGGS